jgi:hypothetical protein
MIFEAAHLLDLVAYLREPRLTVPARLYRHLAAQMAGGPVWVVRRTPAGPPLAIGGGYRFDDGRPGQAWLICVPGLGAHLAGVAGRARAAMRAARDGGPIVAVVRTVAGARIARALGFTRVEARTGCEIWRL